MSHTNLDKVRPWYVYKESYPYYIFCVRCEQELRGRTAEEVAERATREGWAYVVDQDVFLCPSCKRAFLEEQQ